MPSNGVPRHRACCSSCASNKDATCGGSSYAIWYTVASVVPYVLISLTPRASHARIVAGGVGSPPSITVVSTNLSLGAYSLSMSYSAHTDGVDIACVARVSLMDTLSCCNVKAQGARHTVAPTASAAKVIPADGSKIALVATKTREVAVR